MEAAIAHLRNVGADVATEDLERLSPLGFAHINMPGRYQFALADQVQRGQLRDLRDPNQDDDLLAV